ncbi:unnamed protein product [Amoebophrya sp. A25]|nr:unnamed protein product [Amoebophrya sp. A25]|eukprot:GSA25T00004028001.1
MGALLLRISIDIVGRSVADYYNKSFVRFILMNLIQLKPKGFLRLRTRSRSAVATFVIFQERIRMVPLSKSNTK